MKCVYSTNSYLTDNPCEAPDPPDRRSDDAGGCAKEKAQDPGRSSRMKTRFAVETVRGIHDPGEEKNLIRVSADADPCK